MYVNLNKNFPILNKCSDFVNYFFPFLQFFQTLHFFLRNFFLPDAGAGLRDDQNINTTAKLSAFAPFANICSAQILIWTMHSAYLSNVNIFLYFMLANMDYTFPCLSDNIY